MYRQYMLYRDKLGLTDYQVAKKSNGKVLTSTLSEWKRHYETNGKDGYQPKIEKLSIIADILNVKLSDLLGE